MFIVTHRQNMCKLKKLYLCLYKYKQNHRTLAKAREPSDIGDSTQTIGPWWQQANQWTLATACEPSDFGDSKRTIGLWCVKPSGLEQTIGICLDHHTLESFIHISLHPGNTCTLNTWIWPKHLKIIIISQNSIKNFLQMFASFNNFYIDIKWMITIIHAWSSDIIQN